MEMEKIILPSQWWNFIWKIHFSLESDLCETHEAFWTHFTPTKVYYNHQLIKVQHSFGLKDVCANCFCAIVLHMKFTHHVIHWAHVNNNRAMAIAVSLRGFNDLGRTVTPIFLSMGHFLYGFSMFCEKMRKIYQVEVSIFWQTLHRILFFWPLRLPVWQFQMPL